MLPRLQGEVLAARPHPASLSSMFTQTTSGIAVHAKPRFLPEESHDGRFVWSYTIEIENRSADAVQLHHAPLAHHRRQRPYAGSARPRRRRRTAGDQAGRSLSPTQAPARSRPVPASWSVPTRWCGSTIRRSSTSPCRRSRWIARTTRVSPTRSARPPMSFPGFEDAMRRIVTGDDDRRPINHHSRWPARERRERDQSGELVRDLARRRFRRTRSERDKRPRRNRADALPFARPSESALVRRQSAVPDGVTPEQVKPMARASVSSHRRGGMHRRSGQAPGDAPHAFARHYSRALRRCVTRTRQQRNAPEARQYRHPTRHRARLARAWRAGADCWRCLVDRELA